MMESEDEKTPLMSSLPRNDPFAHRRDAPTSFWHSGRASVVLCILFCEMCERLAYYSISANLILFCTDILELSSPVALTVSLLFTGTTYILPVIGGWIADRISGKFNAIYGGLLIYLVGTLILPVISFKHYPEEQGLNKEEKLIYFSISILCVAIGTGCIKSTVGPFGAQQVQHLGDESVQSYFSWFYWFINFGQLFTFSVVVYVQQNISFAVGFLLPAVSILCAIFVFLLQRKSYYVSPPTGSAIVDSMLGVCCAEKMDTIQGRVRSENNGERYKDIKSVLRFIPVFLPITLYWTVYFQAGSSFILQGERLDLRIGKSFIIPVAALNLIMVVIILTLIPLMDRVIYPSLKKLGINMTLLRRIGTGIIFCGISAACAGVVEMWRKEVMREGHWMNQTLAHDIFNASDITVFIQVPQYLALGTSEVFTSIAGLEFAYSQAPTHMQGIIMGVFLLTLGLGGYLGSALVSIVNAITKGPDQWIPNEINDGHLEYFYFMEAGLMCFTFFIFLVIASFYRYVQDDKSDIVYSTARSDSSDQT